MDRLSFRRQVDAAGFVQLSALVLLDAAISDGACRTYQVLLHHARQSGSCFPGQEKLSVERGTSVRAIQRHLHELQDRGIISVERRGRAKTNLYWIEDLEPIYRATNDDTTKMAGHSDDATKMAGHAIVDATKLAHPLRMKNNNDEKDSETLNVSRPQLRKYLPDVGAIVELTGDAKSLKRFAQLYSIAHNADLLGCWDEALESVRARMAPAHKLGQLRRPGAYFCSILAELLLERGVSVPVGSKAERDEVRNALAEAPFMKGKSEQ